MTQTRIEYNMDKTLEIKEEIIQDQNTNEATGQKLNKKYVSKFCTVDIREDDASVAKKLWSQKKEKIQDSKLEKNYKCEKCARIYKMKSNLNRHQKYACDVMPQFSCEFCGKRFKLKSDMNKHTNHAHQKTNAEIPKTRHYCNQCTRSYTLIENLYRHKRLEHAVVKPQFTCDICGHVAKLKFVLSRHVRLHHLK